MRKQLQLIATTIGFVLFIYSVNAQNTSPYWSLAGNSNATSSSQKLGTTNAYPLRITTNNTTRVYISPSAGYLGVGTTSPSARLHVNAASGTSPLKFQVNGATKLYMSSGGGLAVGSGSTAPANGLYVAGNVGIGTTAPAARLHVAGTTPYRTVLLVRNGRLTVDIPWSTGDTSVGIYSSAGTGIWGNGMTGVQGEGMTGVYGSGYNGVIGQGQSEGVSGYSDEGTGVSGYGGAIGVYGSTTGGSGGYAGYFSGAVFATSYSGSDRKLKQNIEEVTSALDIISKLQPKRYQYRQDGNFKLMHLPEGTHYGLIAQDLEQVLPGLVKDTKFDMRLELNARAKQQNGRTTAPAMPQQASEVIDFKAVNYTELIPIIIKGMQEQEAENKALKEQLADQQQQLAALRQVVLELKQGTGALTSTGAYLEQNTPNPVRANTTIRYFIPGTVTSAHLNVTNARGQVLNTIRLTTKGAGQVSLSTGLMAAGTYNYTLYVDGQQADSRRFIITK